MRNLAGKTYWIIGASEGLGRALAKRLDGAGASLVLSARNQERLQSLAKELDGPARVLPLDLSDKAAFGTVRTALGPVDGLIYCAGLYWPMPLEQWNLEQVEAMIDVNMLGAARAIDCVLDDFLDHNSGHLVLIGSLSGFRGLPRANGYGSSKAGLMHMAENLHAELIHSGVDVQLINPGFIETRLTRKNDFKMPFLMSADAAAAQVVKAMQSYRFQTNFPRVFSWLFRGAQFLPAWAYYRLFGRRDQREQDLRHPAQ